MGSLRTVGKGGSKPLRKMGFTFFNPFFNSFKNPDQERKAVDKVLDNDVVNGLIDSSGPMQVMREVYKFASDRIDEMGN